ncbi:MAG: peptidylprolyl isomerase [Chloroflexi bacterium]|nr:peptidylprolyl isomerase [Chloroflexota bacterium]
MTTPSEQSPQPGSPQPGGQQPASPLPEQQTPEQLTRRTILAAQREQRRRNRPFVVAGIVVLVLILAVPTAHFVMKFVLPPRELALRVQKVEYSRGDLVDFIRFNQRLSEEQGRQFEIGSSLFDALQVMAENEIAYQLAPTLGVTVESAELERQIRHLLGFSGLTDAEANQPETKGQIEERYRQFLNNVQLTEERYREIVRKDLFRQEVRDRLGEEVDRIQEQVHVYQIRLDREDKTLLETIRRRLKAGESFSSLALQHSKDPDVKRNGGEIGWLPRGVKPEYDRLFFDSKQDGTRILAIGDASELINDPREGFWNIYYIDEHASAREVEEADFEILKDNAFKDWSEAERKELDVYLVLNDRIYNWVNRQVRLNSILPTPTPYDPFSVSSQALQP